MAVNCPVQCSQLISGFGQRFRSVHSMLGFHWYAVVVRFSNAFEDSFWQWSCDSHCNHHNHWCNPNMVRPSVNRWQNDDDIYVIFVTLISFSPLFVVAGNSVCNEINNDLILTEQRMIQVFFFIAGTLLLSLFLVGVTGDGGGTNGNG